MYSFNKSPYATGFNREKSKIESDSLPIIDCIKRGTKVKAIFESEEEATVPFIRMIEYYESIGEEVRIVESLPIKMLLADSEIAMVSLRNNHASKFKLSSMVVDHSDIAIALMELFENYWENAKHTSRIS